MTPAAMSNPRAIRLIILSSTPLFLRQARPGWLFLPVRTHVDVAVRPAFGGAHSPIGSPTILLIQNVA
jgi:hypothetical protein